MDRNFDLDVKTMILQEERNRRDLQELKESVQKLLSMSVNHSDIPEWLTLEQAVALKGMNLNTVKCNAYLRPGAGNPKMQRYCAGRLVFHRDSVVLPWLNITDETLLDYITITCGLTKIPDKIRIKLEKAKLRSKDNAS